MRDYITTDNKRANNLIKQGFDYELFLEDGRVKFAFKPCYALGLEIDYMNNNYCDIEYSRDDKKVVNDLINDFKRENGIVLEGDWDKCSDK